ncbi:MAG: CHAT domain-containing tetratricopeptide repeat protein [Bacteroidia bacterium]
MRWLILLPYIALSQSSVLASADSLREAGDCQTALVLYDSILTHSAPANLSSLQAYLGAIECLINTHDYKKAFDWIHRAQTVAIQFRDTVRWVKLWYYQAWLWDEEGKHVNAESLYIQVAKWQKKYLGEKHPEYILTLNDLAIVYEHLGHYSKAESIYKKVLAAQAEVLGSQHPDYLITLGNLALLYEVQGLYQLAESLYVQVANLQSQLLGKLHPEYLITLHNLGLVYYRQGQYAQAESLYHLVAEARAKVLGTQHRDYATTLNNLAVIYEEQGRYAEAETLLRKVVEIRERILGPHHPEYLSTLHNLASIYESRGDYAEAEALYQKVADLKASVLGRSHPSYLNTQSCLAKVYERQGRYTEAEELYRRVAEAQARLLSPQAEEYLTTVYNLAVVYARHGKLSIAESLYRKVAETLRQTLGARHPRYLIALSGIAEVLEGEGQYAEAEKLYREVAEVQAEILGAAHPDYLITLQRIGFMSYRQGRFSEAESLYHNVAEGFRRALGSRHPYYTSTLYRIADLAGRLGRYATADSLWKVVIEKSFQYVRQEMAGLPTAYQERFLEANLMGRIRTFHRYVAQRGVSSPPILHLGYRVARSTKGMILTTSEGLRYLAEASSDTLTRRLFMQWQMLVTRSAMLAMQNRRIEADSLWQMAAKVEQRLVQLLPEVRTFLPDPFTESDPKLHRNEVVIEVVRLKERDSIWYLFYLLIPERRSISVRLYVHRVDSAWELQAQNSFEILRMPNSRLTTFAYRLLWSFIDSLLPKGIRRVYFSPDGIYYRINVGALYDGRSFVADRYEVRYIATSRRLIIERRRLPSQKPVVIGNPAFYQASSEGTGIRSHRLFEGGIPPLPGAEIEAREIAALLGVSPFIGDSATEERIKALSNPQVLHIATHGYFREGPGSALLRSGILLAGAGIWDSLYPPAGVEDGHLTAREVSGMNLHGTDLVVLSACETGLGDITGEGLYGLQRAFLEAGAFRVIATLWQIDDAATQDLMILFYRQWIASERKRTKYKKPKPQSSILNDTFTQAIRLFRRKYQEPYYWGAFIMME